MKTKLTVCLIFLISGWVLFAGKGNSAEVKRKTYRVPISTLAPAPENNIPPRPASKYPVNGIKYSANCASIAPEVGIKIEHSQIGTTWYDFQQNGSMGRMISVTNQGYRNFSWMYADQPYTTSTPRYVYANGEDTLGSYIGQCSVDGGATKAGYSNQTHLHDGTSVIVYHRPAGTPVWYTTLALADGPGSSSFSRHWDLPDYISTAPTETPGEWPKAEVFYDATEMRDYIHIVMTQETTSGGLIEQLPYERCYLGTNDTIICQCFNDGETKTYKIPSNMNGPGSSALLSSLDSCVQVSPIVTVSPVSRRVAVAFLKPAVFGSIDYGADVCFVESMDNANDWIAGNPWPPPEYNITNYGTGGTERAMWDLSACYDYQDSLHVIWSAPKFDSTEQSLYPGQVKLRHWSKKTGISTIAVQNQEASYAISGAHNAFIAKPSISADNPLFHPTGDTVYLFCIYTRFDTSDVAANGFGNGDIIISGSNDGGAGWGGKYNITNTHTPNCVPGNCLSEHWSSMAQNMYGGDFHIQYICDKDAGGAIQDSPSAWLENPVMYLHLRPIYWNPPPGAGWRIVSPPQWHSPPLKVAPNGSLNLVFRIFSIGNANLVYAVNSDNSCIQVNIPPSALPPRDSVTITAVLSGSGTCNNSYISGNVNISSNDPSHSLIQLPVQAVVADDYYECPRDPLTYDSLDNGVLQMYLNANGQEWIYDVGSFPDTVHEVFFNGGLFVATTQNSDTLVGRYYGVNDQHTFAREQLYLNSMYNDFWLEYSWNVCMHDLNPPVDTKWWWFEILHEDMFFKSTAPDALKHCVIKFVTAEIHDPPIWWPSQPTFTGYEDTYMGMMMDMDCPYDTFAGQNARNRAGYDATKNIAWQRGWDFTGVHPGFNDYYTGMALIQGFQSGESTVPWGTYNLRNDVYLYPQSPWGWKDGEFYRLAMGNVLGDIQEPDSIVDRSQIVTARKIPAGTNPDIRASFTLVEIAAPVGFSQLQAYTDSARAWVQGKPFIICGDVNNDGSVDVGDIIGGINYLFRGYPNSIAEPITRGDVNSNGSIEVGDIVVLISYLYRSGIPPKCPGVW